MYHADDKIEINEIYGDESVTREAQYARNATLAELFENAVQAYLAEDWDGCVAGFNDVLYKYVINYPVDILSSMINTQSILILWYF